MYHREFKISILFLFLTILFFLLTGTLIFSWMEGWSLIDSFYFVTMTATTVGYGDFTPTHALSKIITIIYSMSIIPIVLYTFSVVAKYETNRVYHRIYDMERKQRKQDEEIEKAEHKLELQHRKIKEQEEELEKQEKELKNKEK